MFVTSQKGELRMSAAKKIFYTMGEVSDLLDLPDSTIRFWEKEFKEIKPKRNAKGNRLFSGEDVTNLKLIKSLLKDRGMTLAGAKEVIKNRKPAVKRELTTLETLRKIRSQLVQLVQDLDVTDEERERTIKIDMEPPKAPDEEKYTTGSLFSEEDFL